MVADILQPELDRGAYRLDRAYSARYQPDNRIAERDDENDLPLKPGQKPAGLTGNSKLIDWLFPGGSPFAPSYDDPPNILTNALHANISPSPMHTPGPVKLGLAAMPTRYMARAFFQTSTDSASPHFLTSWVSPIRDRLFAEPLFEKLNSKLAKIHLPELFPNGIPEDIDDINKELRKTPAGRELKDSMRKMLTMWDSSEHTNNTIQYAIVERDRESGLMQLTDESKRRIRGKMHGPVFEFLYDNSIGVGSLAMTYFIRQQVLRDIKSMYAEAVGFELDKDPTNLTKEEIFTSNNEIIHSTVNNFQHKQLQRLGISAIPFLKDVPQLRAGHWGEFALGAWGLQWIFDVWGRQPTMLELFSEFVNDKLNPKEGIGDPVTSSDIIKLYQQYAFRFHPDQAFKHVINDAEEVRLWERSEKIFGRVAQLMNDSYNYKHKAVVDSDGTPEEFANFTFPKFIYLLGHDMINIRQPEWSMLYIELANNHGMDEVKHVRQLQQNGMNINRVMERYPDINLNPNHSTGLLVKAGPNDAVGMEHAIPVRPEHPIDAKPSLSIATNAAMLQGPVAEVPRTHAHG